MLGDQEMPAGGVRRGGGSEILKPNGHGGLTIYSVLPCLGKPAFDLVSLCLLVCWSHTPRVPDKTQRHP